MQFHLFFNLEKIDSGTELHLERVFLMDLVWNHRLLNDFKNDKFKEKANQRVGFISVFMCNIID